MEIWRSVPCNQEVGLAGASIQCLILVSIAPESPDSKFAKCKAVTLGLIELSRLKKEKFEKYKLD